MIDLTPLEVRKKKGDFRKAMRGYEPQAVDDFIDLVADRLEQLVRDNASLNDRVRSAETQISDYRERERALTEALVTAQEMREEMRRQMEREVEIKMREVEADVESMRSSAAQMREREEENIRRLRARQTQFVQSYRAFLERELAEIGVMAQTLDLSTDEERPAAPARRRSRKPETPAVQMSAPLSEPAPPIAPIMPPVAAAVVIPVVDIAPAVDDDIDDLFTAPALDDDVIEPVRVTEPDPEPPLDDVLIDLEAIFKAEPPEVPYDAPQSASATKPKQMDLSDVQVDEHEVAEEDLVEDLTDEIDEEETDSDADGWVSTLLEGKGE